MDHDYFWLSEAQFARLEPLLPTDTRGKPRVDDRRVISGIVHVLRSGGGRWADAPAVYGPRKTLYNRFVSWAAKGVWANIFHALASAGGPPAGLDRLLSGQGALLCFGRKRGELTQAIGRSRGGRATKIHALTDRFCRPIAFLLTVGQAADFTAADILLEQMSATAILHGDKGYQKLLEDARAGEFDIVLAEALDRLSRDQEDVAALFKQLSFCNVRLVTPAEGEISELHVGLKGTMNALFLKDLAQKTKRGMEGRVRQGRMAGGIAYGYKVVCELDANGEPVRGKRAIDDAEVAVVRRIFEAFAAGRSPRAIARDLNEERIPGPGGRHWSDTTIRGYQARRSGILYNET